MKRALNGATLLHKVTTIQMTFVLLSISFIVCEVGCYVLHGFLRRFLVFFRFLLFLVDYWLSQAFKYSCVRLSVHDLGNLGHLVRCRILELLHREDILRDILFLWFDSDWFWHCLLELALCFSDQTSF